MEGYNQGTYSIRLLNPYGLDYAMGYGGLGAQGYASGYGGWVLPLGLQIFSGAQGIGIDPNLFYYKSFGYL